MHEEEMDGIIYYYENGELVGIAPGEDDIYG
jgi:hypothetical protein